MKDNHHRNDDPDDAAKEVYKDAWFDIPKDEDKGRSKEKPKPELFAYKYNQSIPLAEQIMLNGKNRFLQIKNSKPVVSKSIDLGDRKLKPNESLPFITYAFKDRNELRLFIKLANKETLDSLYDKIKWLCKKLVVTIDYETLVMIATDIAYSYNVDLFPTTHYDMIIGPPGSGKGAIAGVFKLLGYRTVLASSFSGANLLEILGSSEPCQETIIEDELSNSLANDEFKRNTYKTGYDLNGQIFRTLDGNTSARHNRHYYTYSLKIFLAEHPPDSRNLEGLNDRAFRIESIKGRPKFLIKTVEHEMGKSPKLQNPKYKDIISKINYLRKLLFVHRLLHHNDMIEEVNLNIDGRALELTSPQIYLFSSAMAPEKMALKEILPALSKFLRNKGELAQKTLDGVVRQSLNQIFVSRKPTEAPDLDGNTRTLYTISHDDIIDEVKESANGEDSISPNVKAFYSTEYGKITHKFILKICKQRFFGEPNSIGTGNGKARALAFDKVKVTKVGRTFDVVNEIKILDESQDYSKEDEYEDEEYDAIWNGNSNGKIRRSRHTHGNDLGTMGRKFARTVDKGNTKKIGVKSKMEKRLKLSVKMSVEPAVSLNQNQKMTISLILPIRPIFVPTSQHKNKS